MLLRVIGCWWILSDVVLDVSCKLLVIVVCHWPLLVLQEGISVGHCMLINVVEYCWMVLTGIVEPVVCPLTTTFIHIVGQRIGTFTEHGASVRALVVIGDGQLASGDRGGCMTIWVCAAVLARIVHIALGRVFGIILVWPCINSLIECCCVLLDVPCAQPCQHP